MMDHWFAFEYLVGVFFV